MSRQTKCPNCGGPIEFKLGASWALVCEYCRFSVMRTATDIRAIGQVADLVPTAPEVAVGDRVTISGHEYRVGGRMQLDHGRGPWDEWYVMNAATNQWAWLAKAQGHWYMTWPVALQAAPPAWQSLMPGMQGMLIPGMERTWTVAERGQSRLLSAEGELPFPIVPNAQGWFADLAGPGGAFATIDYGDGSQAAKVFVGAQYAPDRVQIHRGGMAPRPQQKVDTSRLRCPRCGAPVPLRVPESTERVGCESCRALLDFQSGDLRFLKEIEQARNAPLIPLGTEGELRGEKLLCIAYMERSTEIDYETFHWREFLLHGANGYRWLMEDNGHWTLLNPVSAGELQIAPLDVGYQGRKHRLFNRVTGEVRHVIGEVYWRVEVGEKANLCDFIDPPYIVSEERNDREIVYSAGEYIPYKEIEKAFGITRPMPVQTAVGLCQPNPHGVRRVSVAGAALIGLLAALFVFFEVIGDHAQVVTRQNVPMPMSSGPVALNRAPYRTPSFLVREGPTTVEVALNTNADNQYCGFEAALLNTDTGEAHDFYVEAGYYSGYSDGGSWSEGSRSARAYVDRLDAGNYVLELAPMWEAYPQPGGPRGSITPVVDLDVTVGKRSPFNFGGALLFLLLPILWVKIRHDMFEKSRRENNSNL